MSNSVLIYSESGAGKSTSIRALNPDETFIINIAKKPLPFKGWKVKYPEFNKDNIQGRRADISDHESIQKTLLYVNNNRPEIKTIVVDDWQYMSSFEYFERADEKGFQKFADIGKHLADVAIMSTCLREDLIIIFLTHVEEITDSEGNRKLKAKTIGKMVDEKLTLEGLFSIVLLAKLIKTKEGELRYVFQTNGAGNDTSKSPHGMFDSRYIPNDLQVVIDAVKKYEDE